jgi:uncharacterized protein YhbP (UPF0306 family)
MTAGTEERIREFLANHTTMTLATVAEDGRPQAASLFYAEMEDLSLVYLSEKKVRHSQNLQRDARAAATVYADGQRWEEIQGLQIEGTCHSLAGQEAEAARAAYVKKFPFIQANVLIAAALKISTFYQLTPEWIRLTDNRQRFGHKEEWRRSDYEVRPD